MRRNYKPRGIIMAKKSFKGGIDEILGFSEVKNTKIKLGYIAGTLYAFNHIAK
jgi:hypothetical protein